MIKTSKWSPKEDEILLEAYYDCYGDLHKALEAASHLLNRTVSACQARWYRKVQYMPRPDNLDRSVTLMNYSRKPQEAKPSLWDKIMTIWKKVKHENK